MIRSYSALNQLSVWIRFSWVGIGNTIVGLLVIYAAKYFLFLGDVLANATGYFFGLGLSFVLNRRWTFRYTGSILSSLMRFLFVTAVAYIMNLCVVLAILRVGGIDSYLAHAFGVLPYTVTCFLGYRNFAFKSLN